MPGVASRGGISSPAAPRAQLEDQGAQCARARPGWRPRDPAAVPLHRDDRLALGVDGAKGESAAAAYQFRIGRDAVTVGHTRGAVLATR